MTGETRQRRLLIARRFPDQLRARAQHLVGGILPALGAFLRATDELAQELPAESLVEVVGEPAEAVEGVAQVLFIDDYRRRRPRSRARQSR